jgi:hypothetical protein
MEGDMTDRRDEILKFYSGLSTDQLLISLRDGNTSLKGLTIGIDELVRRGVSEEAIASIREIVAREGQAESGKRWLWMLVFIPIFLLIKAYFLKP